ncbi:MAG: hypothetical protein M3N19_03455 [Candidatus Eremiobacteraeota bacterium]|nr:hypothetical protein [Candidatus Eremiobacteraeota bacterium]
MKLSLIVIDAGMLERFLWLLAIFGLLTGYYFVTQQYEKKINSAAERTAGLYEKTRTNHQLVAQSTQILLVRAKLQRELGTLTLGTQPGRSIAALLAHVDKLSHQHHARVVAILPQEIVGPERSARTVAPQGERQVLETSAIDISIRGRFSDLLGFVAKLPRGRVLIKITEIRFTVSSGQPARTSKPLLDAKIHALVYRVTSPPLLGAL